MSPSMRKPALDAGIVTADPEPLLAFYRAVAGMELLEPLTLPNIGTIHKLACGESILRVMVPEKAPAADPSESFSALPVNTICSSPVNASRPLSSPRCIPKSVPVSRPDSLS